MVRPPPFGLTVNFWIPEVSGGASYGAKGLKPPQILLKPPPRFLYKVMLCLNKSVTTIIKCHHRRPTFNCEMQKRRLAAGLRPDPLGEHTALPRPPIWIKGPTSKGGQTRSYVQARGGSCLLVPRRLNFLRHK